MVHINPNYINNHLKHKEFKIQQPKGRLSEWIQKQDPIICCLQKAHFKYKNTY